MKKIYIGNLPFDIAEDELNDLFKEHGLIEEIYLVKDRHTRRLKGYAFIEYATTDEANAAIDAMNGYDYHGRLLKVSLAKAEGERTRDNKRKPNQSRKGGQSRHNKRQRFTLGAAVLTIVIAALTTVVVNNTMENTKLARVEQSVMQLRAEQQQIIHHLSANTSSLLDKTTVAN